MTERTHGTLLNGKVRYAQPRSGYRTGIEPVLLAAAVPAQPGDRVLEAGCGAGAGLLCLLWRVAGLHATGIELQPDLAAIARDNLADNGLHATVQVGDVTTASMPTPVEHAFANPPWHDPAATRPPNACRATATHGSGLDDWIGALAAVATGTITLVLPAAAAAGAIRLLRVAGLERTGVTHLLPRAGRTGKIALVQGLVGGVPGHRTATLILHREDGGYTEETDAVLRHGAGLSLAG